MNKDLWNELWDSATDYQPVTEETIKDMTTWKIPANCIAVTEDQLRNEIKSIDNKLYSEYYESDCEDATEAFEIVTRLLDSLNIKYDVSGEETLEIIYYPN